MLSSLPVDRDLQRTLLLPHTQQRHAGHEEAAGFSE
jgi:hypothetical protein